MEVVPDGRRYLRGERRGPLRPCEAPSRDDLGVLVSDLPAAGVTDRRCHQADLPRVLADQREGKPVRSQHLADDAGLCSVPRQVGDETGDISSLPSAMSEEVACEPAFISTTALAA